MALVASPVDVVPAEPLAHAGAPQERPLGMTGLPFGPSTEPPFPLDADFRAGSDEVLTALESCQWLFPPFVRASASAAPAEGTPAPAGAASAGSAGSGSRPEAAVAAEELTPAAPSQPPPEPPAVQYEYVHLRTSIAQGVVNILLAAPRSQGAGDSVAVRMGPALSTFTAQAYKVLTTEQSLPEHEREVMVSEAENAMKELVKNGGVKVATDFVFALEAFGVSRGRPSREQSWESQCLVHLLKAAFEVAEPADVERWREETRNRIKFEAGEGLYSSIDVRNWPRILQLANIERDDIDPEVFKSQVRLQLCMQADTRSWYDGLEQAAILISDMRQAAVFGADEIREIFNDRAHLEHPQRQRLLTTVLRTAPRLIKQQVLRIIDGDDVDVTERDDEEMLLVRNLIRELYEDIRCCRHAFFRMQSDWLAGRGGGVVSFGELSPEQVCDHIEHEDNHEELLRIAVNRCLKNNRKFEAARMLARPLSAGCRVTDTHRNDKQLEYLVSLYKELQPPEDQFGPVEEAALVLPCALGDVLHVRDCGEPLVRLEQEILGSERPMVVGVCWYWRCFDPKLDFWPRASVVAIVYEGTFALVDFPRLESAGAPTERKAKEVIRRIMQAPHVLKVVHDLDEFGLQVLQRALLPHEELAGEEAPAKAEMAPVLDLAVCAAFVRRTRPLAPCAVKLAGLVFDYLRLELCMSEALSNVERRPLRQSQVHYMLTMAWCPVAILRALCSYKVLTPNNTLAMMLRLGGENAQPNWSRVVKGLLLCRSESNVPSGRGRAAQDPQAAPTWQADADDGYAGEPQMVKGAYSENLWEDEQWRSKLPMPDPTFNLPNCLHQQLSPLQVTLQPEAAKAAQPALMQLFDKEQTLNQLQRLYEAYRAYQADQQQPGA